MDETTPRRYENFDIRIERAESGYRARVWSESTGESQGSVDISRAIDTLDGFLFNVGQPRRRARGALSTRLKEAQNFGAILFDGVFRDDVLACLQRSVAQAGSRGVGTRIRLRLGDVPDLSDLPWEFLYNRVHHDFLSLSTHTPIVRYLECPETIRPFNVAPPLRILAIIASPSDYPHLDVEREWSALAASLSDLTRKGLVELSRIDKPQFSALPRALRQPIHILHFIGHGEFSDDGGGLVFEDDQRRGKMISGDRLGTILRDHQSLRLVVLNACEGARASRADAFSGTAQMLIARGIPAVLAMQFEITDEAAITIASEFYTSLAVGEPIDTALADARRKLFALQDDGVEWATPVLYLRASDGAIFNVAQTDAVAEVKAAVKERGDEEPPLPPPVEPQPVVPPADTGRTSRGNGATADAKRGLPVFALGIGALVCFGALIVYRLTSLGSSMTSRPFDPREAIIGRWSAAGGTCAANVGTVTAGQGKLYFSWPRGAGGPPNQAVERIVTSTSHTIQTLVESDINTDSPQVGQTSLYDVQDKSFTSTNAAGQKSTHTKC